MLRIDEYRCPKHGVFEVLRNIDMKDAEARASMARHVCKCGEESPRVWTTSPALKFGEAGVRMGGRDIPMSVIEEKLHQSTPQQNFQDTPEFEREFMAAIQRNTERELAGTLPPVYTESDVQAVSNAIKE
jgi:hypothetical protein